MTTERIKMVKAMEFLARQMNDEAPFFNIWLPLGVPYGDIEYGDLSDTDPDGVLELYENDEDFADLMYVFLRVMKRACSHGLYCDGVVTKTPVTN